MNGSRKSAALLFIRLAALIVAALGLAATIGAANQPDRTQTLQPQSLTGAQLEAQATKADMEDSWGLKSIFAQDAQRIAAEKAEAAGAADKPVCVAILDTGFYPEHETLKGKVVAEWNAAAIGEVSLANVPEQRRAAYLKTNMAAYRDSAEKASIEPPTAIASDQSEANHGIHVASILRSVDPDANLILVRVADEMGEMPTWALFNAFALINEYRDEFNIRVVNCSAGSAGEPTDPNTWEYMTLQQINTAYQNGIVTVGSAGNDASTTFNFPSDCENVVGVMSLERTKANDPHSVRRLSTSNYNASGSKAKNICAPGGSIVGAIVDENGKYGYGAMSGTSMAAPHVAGTLALMMEDPSYEFNAAGAQAAVTDLYRWATRLGTVDSNGWSEEYGWGEVNAAKAVAGGLELSGPSSIPAASTLPNSYSNPALEVVNIGNHVIAEWSSSPEGVVKVEGGSITVIKAGNTTISATIEDESGNRLFTLKKTINVEPLNIEEYAPKKKKSYAVQLYYGDLTYTGAPIKPETPVYIISSKYLETPLSKIPANEKRKLVEGVDYAIPDDSYANNVNAGTKAVLAVEGKGAYTGTLKFNFTIDPAPLAASNVKLAQTKFTYDGKAHKPAVAVSSNGKTLTKGTDYTVKWENYIAAGTAKVTVTGKGNYGGTATKTYTISKAKNTLAVKALARSASASTLKGKAQTLACPVSVTKAQGAVTFAKMSGNSKISVNKKTGKLKLARGLKKGTYKVKIQVHAAGTASYYGLSKQVNATVRVA